MTGLTDLDRRFVWHPYTQPSLEAPPLVVTNAAGCKLLCEDGREIIDAVSSWWLSIHGHAHPYITQKIKEQLEKFHHVIFAGFTHEPAVKLAERLAGILPGEASRIFFSDDGSTAVEAALKMALQFWHNQGSPRVKILALNGGYHGDTFGAMAVSARGDTGFAGAFERLLFDVSYLPIPTEENRAACLEALGRELEGDEAAAFIFEPLVQGAGGMRIHSPSVLSEMVALCHEYGVITIADEVFTGFGRTGNLFASNYLSAAPDIFCLSKGLTGGTLPMGVTACSDEIYQAFLSADRQKMLMHGHSFTANPISCAAALASLDLLERAECMENIQRIAGSHREFCERLEGNPKITKLRCLGTILAYDIKVEGSSSYYQPLRDKLYSYFLDKGLLLRPLGNVVYTVPPYCVSDSELAVIHNAMEQVLNEI